MMFLSHLIKRFRGPDGTEAEETVKSYGWVKYSHLKPFSVDVEEIGIYDPDLLIHALKQFLKESPGIVNEIRIATYPHKEVDSQYIMIQDGNTTELDRWMCISPKQWADD